MAFVASSCSQLVWHFWYCESSPFTGGFCASFPLDLCPATAILKWDLSFLCGLALELGSSGVSAPSWCEAVSDASSLPALFVELRESCDLDLVSPFMIVFKWVVKVFSESSGLSWQLLSCESSESTAGGGSWSLFASAGTWGESYWETTIDGRGEPTLPFWTELQWFSKDGAVGSGCEDDTVFSLGTSVCRLELCKEHKQSGCESPPEMQAFIENSQKHIKQFSKICLKEQANSSKHWLYLNPNLPSHLS